jgi:hypothetical protein
LTGAFKPVTDVAVRMLTAEFPLESRSIKVDGVAADEPSPLESWATVPTEVTKGLFVVSTIATRSPGATEAIGGNCEIGVPPAG